MGSGSGGWLGAGFPLSNEGEGVGGGEGRRGVVGTGKGTGKSTRMRLSKLPFSFSRCLSFFKCFVADTEVPGVLRHFIGVGIWPGIAIHGPMPGSPAGSLVHTVFP